MTFKDVLKAVCAAIWDFVCDKNGGSDEKRLFGCVFFVAALIVVFLNIHKLTSDVWTTAGGLAGFGLTLVTVAGAQDGIAPKGNGQ